MFDVCQRKAGQTQARSTILLSSSAGMYVLLFLRSRHSISHYSGTQRQAVHDKSGVLSKWLQSKTQSTPPPCMLRESQGMTSLLSAAPVALFEEEQNDASYTDGKQSHDRTKKTITLL
jgi:hypothetical protein